MKKLPTKTVRGVRIVADDLVIGIIDRLMKNDKRLDNMQQELNSHLEMIAELQPKLTTDNKLTMRAMRIGDDSAEEFTVTLHPTDVLHDAGSTAGRTS